MICDALIALQFEVKDSKNAQANGYTVVGCVQILPYSRPLADGETRRSAPFFKCVC